MDTMSCIVTCIYMYIYYAAALLHVHVCLGCAVLLCLVCLFDLACFFLSSFSSLIKKHVYMCACTVHLRIYMYIIDKTTNHQRDASDTIHYPSAHAARVKTATHTILYSTLVQCSVPAFVLMKEEAAET